jgi:hypothetical protein
MRALITLLVNSIVTIYLLSAGMIYLALLGELLINEGRLPFLPLCPSDNLLRQTGMMCCQLWVRMFNLLEILLMKSLLVMFASYAGRVMLIISFLMSPNHGKLQLPLWAQLSWEGGVLCHP